MNEMDNMRIRDFLLEKRADWIVWKKNPPMASHMGGVWERQIRSARTILSSLIRTHSMSLDEDSRVLCLLKLKPLLIQDL